MSASREKKQRQGTGPSAKVTQAQQEQAAYKRKARTYTIIGVVVVVLVAALLIWNSDSLRSRSTAATVGDEKLSVSEMSYYYYHAREMYASFGVIDTTRSDADQLYDPATGTTYRDFFLENALKDAQMTQAIYDAAVAAGHTEDEVKDNVAAEVERMKSSAASSGYGYKAFLKAVYGRYMTPAVFEDMTSKSLLVNLYSAEVAGEKYDGFTLDELEAYYDQHADDVDTFEYSYLFFKADTVAATDEAGNERTEEEIKALKEAASAAANKKAEAAAEAFKSGTSIADLIKEYELTNSADHATNVGTSSINSAFRDELLKLTKDGDVTVVDTETAGSYVVVFHSRGRNEDLTAAVRHILFSAETTVDENGKLVAPTEEAWAAALAEAEAALAEYEAGELTAEAFGALAEKYSDDTGSSTNGGLYEDVPEGRFVPEFNDWMFGEDRPESGDTAIIRHEGDVTSSSAYWGYHVVYFQSWGDAEWMLTVRTALRDEAVDEWATDLAAAEGYATALAKGAENLGQ